MDGRDGFRSPSVKIGKANFVLPCIAFQLRLEPLEREGRAGIQVSLELLQVLPKPMHDHRAGQECQDSKEHYLRDAQGDNELQPVQRRVGHDGIFETILSRRLVRPRQLVAAPSDALGGKMGGYAVVAPQGGHNMHSMAFDHFNKEASYRCECGGLVSVSVSALVPGSTDYCGCGRLKIALTREQVAEYRKDSGLPELPEG